MSPSPGHNNRGGELGPNRTPVRGNAGPHCTTPRGSGHGFMVQRPGLFGPDAQGWAAR